MTVRRVLVCVAHPDDEALGCGGTMARHASEGDEVHVVFLTDGVGSRKSDGRDVASETTERRAAAGKAAALLGAKPPTFIALEDQRLDAIPLLEVTQTVEAVLNDLRPQIVYTHHHGDLNSDHRVAALAVLTAARPFPGQPISAIYGFEVSSSTEWAFGTQQPFLPNRFVSIADSLQRKLDALDAYGFEMRDFPHPRSPEAMTALARHRGASVGMRAAEAFMVYRDCRL